MSNYRAPLRTIVTDWRAGEIDPRFNMRVDSKALPSGARSLRNMLLNSTGGASRRPGMTVVAQLAGRARLVEFEFDANEKYVVAFGVDRIDIYDAAGVLQQSFEGSGVPWDSTAVVWELNVVQKGDVMIIVHNSFQMRRLRRTGLSSFVLEVLAFSSDAGTNVFNQPYIRYQKEAVALSTSITAPGAGTLYSSPPIFTAAWVGERVRIYNCEILITGFTSASTVTSSVKQNVKAELGIAPFRATAGSTVIEVTHPFHGLQSAAIVTIEGAGAMFNLTSAHLNGDKTITVIDSDRYVFVAPIASDTSGDGGGARATAKTTNYCRNWTEQVWSNRHGWPGAVTLHENRVWLGGGIDLPTFLAGSAVGDYYDFNVRDGLDDESVQGTISALSKIVHLVSAKNLQIFCESQESIVETQNGEPITPGTLKVVSHTSYGVDPNVRPRPFDGATVFAQRNGKNIREMIYDYNTDAQVASPISILASHMINKPNDVATLLGTATRPEQYAFFVNADGTCACFHSIRSEQLAAWTRFTCGGGGLFDSVCVIGSSIFFSVKRGGVYFLERFELDATDVWLDGAVRVSGNPSDTWPLGSRYANATVTVMALGWWLGTYQADAAGTVTLPYIVTGPVVAGYDYGVEVIPQPPDKELTDGPMTGEIRRVLSATVHFYGSVSAAVNGKEQLGFTIGQNPAAAPVPISAKKKIRMLGYGRDPTFVITQPNPGPLTVLGMSMEVSI